jgi:hypothetical protein
MLPLNRTKRAILRDRRRPEGDGPPIVGPLTGWDLFLAHRYQDIMVMEHGIPVRKSRREYFGYFEPDNPCRIMDTRSCPPAGTCSGPCARFESDDPTPWIP